MCVFWGVSFLLIVIIKVRWSKKDPSSFGVVVISDAASSVSAAAGDGLQILYGSLTFLWP